MTALEVAGATNGMMRAKEILPYGRDPAIMLGVALALFVPLLLAVLAAVQGLVGNPFLSGAWAALEGRYGKISVTGVIALLEQMLDYSPQGCTVAEHVTGWQELVRQLTEDHKMELHPQLLSQSFL